MLSAQYKPSYVQKGLISGPKWRLRNWLLSYSAPEQKELQKTVKGDEWSRVVNEVVGAHIVCPSMLSFSLMPLYHHSHK